MAHLALIDEFLHGAGDLLDRDVRVDAVLVEQVDPISPKPLRRLVDAPNDGLPAAVYLPGSDRAFEVEAEFRRDHNLVADGLERLADELLVGERAVELGGVKNVTPRSTAARISETIASFSGNGG